MKFQMQLYLVADSFLYSGDAKITEITTTKLIGDV
jgi:hypothetical protein